MRIRTFRTPSLDPSVFESWMRVHYGLVLSQARRMLGVHEDAEDVAQQVFIRAWKHWDRFSGTEEQRVAWLLKITRNATIDQARKRAVRRMVPLDAEIEERTAAVMASPEFEGDRILARLHAAVASLPPKQRWVFQARYFDARSYADLAEETGTSEGALKASYHHARQKVEGILRDAAAQVFGS